MATKQVRKDYHMKLYKNPPEVYVSLGEAADRKANMAWHRLIMLAIMAGSTNHFPSPLYLSSPPSPLSPWPFAHRPSSQSMSALEAPFPSPRPAVWPLIQPTAQRS